VIYLDGIRFGDHHVIAAVGVDRSGTKHVLGVRDGASENTAVVTALLEDLVTRGVDPKRCRLFVIDGSKALRRAVQQVFGRRHYIQRCRSHKLRNVIEHLPRHLRPQTLAAMRAAYRLGPKEGIGRLEKLAAWLEKEHPSAAASLREGLEETFTVARLSLSPSLLRCLTTTNIIENSHGGLRQKTRRVTRWKDGSMVMRWAASALLATEKKYRKVLGYRDLWQLESVLNGKEVEEQKAA
jgi:putative transposase